MNYLIFFDINGTIIERDKRTDLPYEKAMNVFLNVENSMEGVNNSARSDKDVFIEVLSKYKESFSEKKWTSFLKIYEEKLEAYKETDVWRANADVMEFLPKLYGTNHKLSLITGELSLGAKYKLEKIGVWNYFPTGGFGEDALKRFEIADVALKKAKETYSSNFDEIYVIGDTTLDIRTARHIGAKVISITTGSNTREELLEEKPDYLIDAFKEIEDLFLK